MKRAFFLCVLAVALLSTAGCEKTDRKNVPENRTSETATGTPEAHRTETAEPLRQVTETVPPWTKTVVYEKKYRENHGRMSNDFTGGYFPLEYVEGKYLALYETSEGVVALEQEATLWKLVAREDGSYEKQRLCNLLDDCSDDRLLYSSYKTAFQIGDTLYFAKNKILYACDMATGEITVSYDFSGGSFGYLAVLGGTEDAVLLAGCNRQYWQEVQNYCWDIHTGSAESITWEGAVDNNGLSLGNFDDMEFACMGYSGDEILVIESQYSMYAANIRTGKVRRLAGIGRVGRNEQLDIVYAHNAKTMADSILFNNNCSLWKIDMQAAEPDALTCLYAAQQEDNNDNNNDNNLEAFDVEGDTYYLLFRHLGESYPDDEQGSILYTLDTASGGLHPMTGVLQGMNRPAEMVVHDKMLYVISSDGREIDVCPID